MQDTRFKIKKYFYHKLLIGSWIYFALTASLFAMNNSDIASYQKAISNRPLGDRIALWAEKFVGTSYDPDPLGEYVAKKAIVADERVDCMYLSFRALELAMGNTPGEAIIIALDKRFIGKGILKDGLVVNYEDRFQYGEDMIDSGKWGKEITRDIGQTTNIKGTRGTGRVEMVSKKTLVTLFKRWRKKMSVLKGGDFIFFIKSPRERVSGEIVGHIGILKQEGDNIYLIHAGGQKNKGGVVKKLLLYDYISSMPFVGVRVTRFD